MKMRILRDHVLGWNLASLDEVAGAGAKTGFSYSEGELVEEAENDGA